SVRFWTCETCQTVHDRDVNAAINILNEGLKQLQLVV
ncbi:MAG: zinc ribbon domain-containing protein, partial [Lysinibacillus sp.]